VPLPMSLSAELAVAVWEHALPDRLGDSANCLLALAVETRGNLVGSRLPSPLPAPTAFPRQLKSCLLAQLLRNHPKAF
jgi:hypothetical protein